MKTEIKYKKLDGSNGVALVPGSVEAGLAAKRELADRMNLPLVPGQESDADARLRNGGVDPESLTVQLLSASA